ncbi:MAG: hypothetical protein JWO95_600 [Verrucomicrobiales bacterium]|nr:hypothetical protein [Verrucomicrobiales bacterium]
MKTFTEPTQDEIAAYAYKLWEADGRPNGRDGDHWLQAKAHLTADRQYEAGVLASPTATRDIESKKKRKADPQNGRSNASRQAVYG